MNRWNVRVAIMILSIGMASAFFSCSSKSRKNTGRPPNLLLILVDDLGYGDLAVYGHSIVKTPHIDQLAKEGMLFTQYYAPAPLCSPSRAGLLTGRTPYRTDIRSWIPDGQDVHIGKNEITLAHLFKQKGYQTAVMGKLHLNGGLEMEDHPQPWDLGFDHSFVIPGGWAKNKAVEDKRPDGSLRRGKLYPDNFWRNGKAIGETQKFSGELVADEVIAWLDTLDAKQPFFAYVPFSEVHTPIASPQTYLDMYADHITDFAKENPDLFHWDWANQPYRGSGEYFANISFLDAQVGRIREKLEAMGEWDNTLVIFTSDNGPVTREARKPWELNMVGETNGFRGRKGDLFEGGIRVPAILRYPALVEAGQISDEAVYGLDWLPTLAEVFDLEIPIDRPIDGQSISAVLKGEPLDREKPMIWTIDVAEGDYILNEWLIRDEAWKLILDREERPQFLFNLEEDFYEMNNLLGKREDVLLPLLEKFDVFRKSIETDSVNVE